MAWWYNNRKKLKEGKPWYDDSGLYHQYNWVKLTDEDKAARNVTWQDEDWVLPLVFYNAIGGNITINGNYKYHTFTGSGIFEIKTASNIPETLDYVVIAGGGGSGDNNLAAGRAGNMIINAMSAIDIDTGKYIIIVGAGGAGSNLIGGIGGSSSAFSTSCDGGAGGGDNNRVGYASSALYRLHEWPTISSDVGDGGRNSNLSDKIFNGNSGIVVIRYKYK